MAEEIPQQIKSCYDKASLALDRNNFDYAIHLLSQALALKPDLDETRYRLRLAAKKRLEIVPLSAMDKITGKIKMAIPFLKAILLERKGRHLEASLIYEEILCADPYNALVLIHLATALENCEMIDLATRTFEEVLKQQPDNLAVLKTLAQLFTDLKDYAKARPLYQNAARLVPQDEEVRQKLKDIDALASIQKGKWENQESYRDKIKDVEEAQVLEKKDKIVRTESDIDILIQENLKKLESDPENHVFLRTLGDLCSRKNDFDKASEYYHKVLTLDPKNLAIKRRLGEITFKKDEYLLDIKETELEQDPTNETLKKEIEELKNQLEDLKLEQLAGNVAQYPNDLSLRYQYGCMLFSRNLIDKAIAEFQASINDPLRRSPAHNMLGLCFKKKNMFDMAVTQFQKSLEKLTSLDDKKKEVLYNLGNTYEDMGKFKEALTEFKKIYEVDINFRDIAVKVDEAYKLQQEQAQGSPK